jgi:hypothetical protein
MSRTPKQSTRRPAAKFPHLVKKIQKAKPRPKPGKKK